MMHGQKNIKLHNTTIDTIYIEGKKRIAFLRFAAVRTSNS